MNSNGSGSSSPVGGSDQLYIELERIIASVSEDMPFYERLNWLQGALKWLRTHHSHFSHPQYIFELLDKHPRAKARCARALRSILRELAAVDFLFNVDCRNRPASEVYENDIANVLQSIFVSADDLVWFSRVDAETIRGFIALFSFEFSPTERKWNRLNEDVRQALVLLGSEMRLTARAWTKLQRTDRNEIFDQTAYARIGLLIDHLIVAKNDRQAGESPLIAQELYLLIRQCRRQVDDARQRLAAEAGSQEEVEHAELLFRQLTRLKTLINIYTHRTTFVRDAIKLLMPLIESYLEGAAAPGMKARIATFSKAADKVSEATKALPRYRLWKRTGPLSAIFGGVAFAVVASLMISVESFPIFSVARCPVEFLALSVGLFVVSKFNYKIFGEILPWNLSQIGRDIRKVSAHETAQDEVAQQAAVRVKNQISILGLNVIGLLPSIFWMSLMSYIFTHHALVDKDSAVKIATGLSQLPTLLLGGVLTGVCALIATLYGSHVQMNLSPFLASPARFQKLTSFVMAHAGQLVSGVVFAGIYLILDLGLSQISPDLHMHFLLLDLGKFVLAFGAAANAIFAAKLFGFSLLGLGVVAIVNLLGSLGVTYALSLITQARSVPIRLPFFIHFLVHLKPVGGIVSTRAGVNVPDNSLVSQLNRPAPGMGLGGQVKTRGSSFAASSEVSQPGIVVEGRLNQNLPQVPKGYASANPQPTSHQSNEKTEVMLRPPLRAVRSALAQSEPLHLEPIDLGSDFSEDSNVSDKTEVMSKGLHENANERTEVVARGGNEKTEVISNAMSDKTEVVVRPSFSTNEKTEVVSLRPTIGLGEYGAPPVPDSSSSDKTEVAIPINQKRKI